MSVATLCCRMTVADVRRRNVAFSRTSVDESRLAILLSCDKHISGAVSTVLSAAD